MSRLAIAIVASLLAISPTLGTPVTPTDITQQWAADWRSKKLDAIMVLYASEPVFSPGAGGRWVGAAVIRKNFAAVLAQYTADLDLQSLRSSSSGELGYDSGSYEEVVTPVRSGATLHYKGNYLFLFQRQKTGAWKILEQTWTAYDPAKL
jgi:ketosteroid isomerase-like protein